MKWLEPVWPVGKKGKRTKTKHGGEEKERGAHLGLWNATKINKNGESKAFKSDLHGREEMIHADMFRRKDQTFELLIGNFRECKQFWLLIKMCWKVEDLKRKDSNCILVNWETEQEEKGDWKSLRDVTLNSRLFLIKYIFKILS